jgi:dephospho-CoA kinase
VTRERADVVAVGLTGGIGAGKSTALGFLGACGALTLSADEEVHRLYQREHVVRALAERFGSGVLALGGQVDRRALAAAVRGKREELAWLEALMHPLVGEEIERFISEAPAGSVVVCEVPLLFEAHMRGLFDLVVSIEAGADARRERSVHAFPPEQFGELEALQASSERRVAGSDMSYFNDADAEALRSFAGEVYERALALLQARGGDGGGLEAGAGRGGPA